MLVPPVRARTPCAAPAPPRSTSSSATTHEIRIVDVLIISMLMPSTASTSNIFAATPGMRLHARADRARHDRCRSSVRKPVGLGLDDDLVHHDSTHARRRRAGRVNEMSVWPAVDTFCTIMSTLIPASASVAEHVAATPGRSGTCSIVIFASDDVVRDTGDDRLLHRCHRGSSSVTHVPGAQVKLERTCTCTS